MPYKETKKYINLFAALNNILLNTIARIRAMKMCFVA